MSSDYESVLITVVILNHIRYLSSAQSFGTHPVLYDPLMFNRRMLVYPTNVYTWPRPTSIHCCSNGNADLIPRHEGNRLNLYERISYATERINSPYSKNFAQLENSSISPNVQQLTKQKTLDYFNGIKDRLRLRTTTTESLLENRQNENNNSKYIQYLYLSTTEKMIKSKTIETYYVSVKPIQVFDESAQIGRGYEEKQSRENLSSANPSKITQIGEENHKLIADKETKLVDNLELFDPTVVAPLEITITNVKSHLENESLPTEKGLDLFKVVTTTEDCKQGNKTSSRLVNATYYTDTPSDKLGQINDTNILRKFLYALDSLERKFYQSTFTKLLSNSPAEKAENGISFVQSGLLLHLMLTALTTTLDPTTRAEIEACNNFPATEKDKISALKLAINWLPTSSNELRFRWSNRLLLGPAVNVTDEFRSGTAAASHITIETLNTTSDPELLMNTFNQIIEKDSGGAMRDTFDEDDLSQGVHSVLLSTMYVRGHWRSAPTLLDGYRAFYDADRPKQLTRMIRINDLVRYADLKALDAEAVEISYSTPGLSLVVVVPRGRSLRALARHVAATGVRALLVAMTTRRLAVAMPLYTLRMTLLLPNKLQDMGITRLVSPTANVTSGDTLQVSHAVQRLMFWSEAGRNAYKDDGIEWDEVPEMELVLDRPYLFYVRWQNVTLMNGHFVL